jgi:hypothetical protein
MALGPPVPAHGYIGMVCTLTCLNFLRSTFTYLLLYKYNFIILRLTEWLRNCSCLLRV